VPGHTHTSLTAVDVLVTGAPFRAQFTEAFAGILHSPVHA
jgi:hypothetical protein